MKSMEIAAMPPMTAPMIAPSLTAGAEFIGDVSEECSVGVSTAAESEIADAGVLVLEEKSRCSSTTYLDGGLV